MEILIEFGGDIGAPYGRESYTRMGHIEILGYDGIDYGLNSQGANWTASSTYGTPNSSTSSIGVVEPKAQMHFMTNTGLKWYKCENINIKSIKSITFYSSSEGSGYYVDFPKNIRITIFKDGIANKIIGDILELPTAPSQRNKTINIDMIFIRNLIKSNNKIYTLVDNTWMEVSNSLSDQAFIEQGITNITGVKEEQWIQLKSPIEILTWCDSDISGISIEYDYNELILPKAVITVPPYRLLDTLEDPKLLIYSEAENPTLNIKAIPKPQLIKPTKDILLRMLDSINNITIYSNKAQNGVVKTVFSVDGGATWKTYNSSTLEFEDIDISNLEEVKNNGMDIDTFNTIGTKWNEVITESKIRFAYYLEIDTLDDIAAVDKLDLNMDIQGRMKKAKHGVDYDYEYDNEHIYVSFLTDGSYKINYTV